MQVSQWPMAMPPSPTLTNPDLLLPMDPPSSPPDMSSPLLATNQPYRHLNGQTQLPSPPRSDTQHGRTDSRDSVTSNGRAKAAQAQSLSPFRNGVLSSKAPPGRASLLRSNSGRGAGRICFENSRLAFRPEGAHSSTTSNPMDSSKRDASYDLHDIGSAGGVVCQNSPGRSVRKIIEEEEEDELGEEDEDDAARQIKQDQVQSMHAQSSTRDWQARPQTVEGAGSSSSGWVDESDIIRGPEELANETANIDEADVEEIKPAATRRNHKRASILDEDENAPDSHAAMTRRAEEILANAKKRLTNMEGNLHRARSTLGSRPSSSLSFSSQDPSSTMHAPARERRFGSFSTSRRRGGEDEAMDRNKGHTRMSSETSLQYSARSLAGGTGRSDLNVSAERWFWSGLARSTSLSERQRHNVLTSLNEDIRPTSRLDRQPIREEDEEADADDELMHGRTQRAGSLPTEAFSASAAAAAAASVAADRKGSKINGGTGISRAKSTTQMRDLREQMSDLKGKISSLKEKARIDSLRRRSLQNLRTPSPLTNANVSHAYSRVPAVTDSTLSTAKAKENHNDKSRPHKYIVSGTSSREKYARPAAAPECHRQEDLRHAEAKRASPPRSAASHYVYSSESHGDQIVDDEPEMEGRRSSFSSSSSSEPDITNMSPAPEAQGESLDESTERLDQPLYIGPEEQARTAENGDNQAQRLAQSSRHEDRADAFDYGHFFLHSAMGHYAKLDQAREEKRGEVRVIDEEANRDSTHSSNLSQATERPTAQAGPLSNDASAQENEAEPKTGHEREVEDHPVHGRDAGATLGQDLQDEEGRQRQNSIGSSSTNATFATAVEGGADGRHSRAATRTPRSARHAQDDRTSEDEEDEEEHSDKDDTPRHTMMNGMGTWLNDPSSTEASPILNKGSGFSPVNIAAIASQLAPAAVESPTTVSRGAARDTFQDEDEESPVLRHQPFAGSVQASTDRSLKRHRREHSVTDHGVSPPLQLQQTSSNAALTVPSPPPPTPPPKETILTVPATPVAPPPDIIAFLASLTTPLSSSRMTSPRTPLSAASHLASPITPATSTSIASLQQQQQHYQQQLQLSATDRALAEKAVFSLAKVCRELSEATTSTSVPEMPNLAPIHPNEFLPAAESARMTPPPGASMIGGSIDAISAAATVTGTGTVTDGFVAPEDIAVGTTDPAHAFLPESAAQVASASAQAQVATAQGQGSKYVARVCRRRLDMARRGLDGEVNGEAF